MKVKVMRSTVGGLLPQERPCKYHSLLITVFTLRCTVESRADLNYYYYCLQPQYAHGTPMRPIDQTTVDFS